jgi:hypothetical protein
MFHFTPCGALRGNQIHLCAHVKNCFIPPMFQDRLTWRSVKLHGRKKRTIYQQSMRRCTTLTAASNKINVNRRVEAALEQNFSCNPLCSCVKSNTLLLQSSPFEVSTNSSLPPIFFLTFRIIFPLLNHRAACFYCPASRRDLKLAFLAPRAIVDLSRTPGRARDK